MLNVMVFKNVIGMLVLILVQVVVFVRIFREIQVLPW